MAIPARALSPAFSLRSSACRASSSERWNCTLTFIASLDCWISASICAPVSCVPASFVWGTGEFLSEGVGATGCTSGAAADEGVFAGAAVGEVFCAAAARRQTSTLTQQCTRPKRLPWRDTSHLYLKALRDDESANDIRRLARPGEDLGP